MKITTNHKERELLSYWQLSKRELEQFGYIENMEEEGISRFFRYYGRAYDTNDFMRIPDSLHWQGGEWHDWHGSHPETYFSGVLIRYSQDRDSVVVGRYFTNL